MRALRHPALGLALTIPVFELTVVEWVTVQQAAQAADAQTAVSEATETAMQGFADATAQAAAGWARPLARRESLTLAERRPKIGGVAAPGWRNGRRWGLKIP